MKVFIRPVYQNNSEDRQQRCSIKGLEGSMTIEAAVVTAVSMVIILAVIFLSFYANNRAAMSAVDYYSAMEYAGQAGNEHLSDTSIRSELEESLYGAYGISAGVNGGDDVYTAWSDASFNMPFPMIGQMFDPQIRQMHSDVEISFLQGRKRLLLYKSICTGLPELLKKAGKR